ncbi:MAG: hypothetical protein JWQ97_3912 [Phenylobacterium sp.]|nr:hypothetical protein [Phenylobacterium sp.]
MNGLTRLAEWTVPDDEIDHLGHMSALFYGVRARQGAAAMLANLCAGAAELEAAGLVIGLADHHTLFRREQMAASPLQLSGAVTGVAERRIELYQEMGHAGAGELAAMFNSGIELRDRATRRPVVIPAPCLEAARARQVEPTHRSQPRTLTLASMGAELTLADFRRVGIASHMRRKIRPEDCDELGFYAPPPPRIFWTKESSNQGVMDGVWGSVPGFVWPSMEMRTMEFAPIRAGDVLDSYTALISVGHKVIHSGVWVFEALSGALVSTNHQVNIFFNFETRRAQDMPAHDRARIAALATPELLAKPDAA